MKLTVTTRKKKVVIATKSKGSGLSMAQHKLKLMGIDPLTPWEPGEPWEQQFGETGEAYEAFRLFRDQGIARQIKATAETMGKSAAVLYDWVGKWNWWSRARTYDAHLDAIELQEHEREVRMMARKHARLGTQMRNLAEQRLGQISSDPLLQAEMTVNDVVKLAVEGTKIERLAAGEGDGHGEGNITFIIGTEKAPKWLPPALKGDAGAVSGDTDAN